MFARSAIAIAFPVAAATAASTPPPTLAVVARLAMLARLLRGKVSRLLHELILGRHFVLGFGGEFVSFIRKRKIFRGFARPGLVRSMELFG